jgi:hypothetical protein
VTSFIWLASFVASARINLSLGAGVLLAPFRRAA